MLLKSDGTLEDQTKIFLDQNERIILFSAYIKLDQLAKLNHQYKVSEIVVRWAIEDLVKEVSDIALFKYCKENNIILYRNERIHLKAFWNTKDSVLFGSANVTGRGIGEKGLYNFELNGIQEGISFNDKLYLKQIIKDSQVVDARLFAEIKKLVDSIESKEMQYPKLPDKVLTTKDSYLLSELPMSENLNQLFECYTRPDSMDNLSQDCLAHDLLLYHIDSGLNRDQFYDQLNVQFKEHPFIQDLKGYISSANSRRYGEIVNWIKENTTTVPTPRSWELKEQQIVNILYEWICYFDTDFEWNVPGARSQVIAYKPR